MKRILHPFIISLTTILLSSIDSFAQIQVTANPTPQQIIDQISGQGVTISNVTRICPNNASGLFSNGATTNLGLDAGAVLTTGRAVDVIGSNGSWPFPPTDASTNHNAAGYQPLQVIAGSTTYDACRIEFDFTPSCSNIQIKYIFGSEEYRQWVGSSYNDAFAFFVTGPNPQGGTYNNRNIALVPNTTSPVTINTINNGTNNTGPCVNCAYYVNNGNGAAGSTSFNGFTTPLTAQIDVVACQTYKMILAIADGGDGTLDSGVFLEMGGLNCPTAVNMAVVPDVTTICPGDEVTLSATNSYSFYSWEPNNNITLINDSTVIAKPDSSTTYYITGTNYCGDTVTIETMVNVNHVLSTFTFDNPVCITNNGNVNYSGNATSGATFNWDFGSATVVSGSGSGPYSLIFPSLGSYPVSLIVTHQGCTSVVTTETIQVVNDMPEPGVASPVIYCQGRPSTPLTANGSNLTWYTSQTGGTGSSTAPQPNTSQTGTTSYYVSQTVNGCESDRVEIQVTVYATPAPPTVIANVEYCEGATAATLIAGGTNLQWYESQSSTNGSANAPTPITSPSGTYNYYVTQTENGCESDKAQTTVLIKPIPTIPTANNNGPGCIGLSINFTTPNVSNAIFTWTGPNGYSSNSQNPVLEITNENQFGEYNVTVTVNGCSSQSGSTTLVKDPVDANFTANPTEGFYPLTVDFFNTSSNASGYVWQIGNDTSYTSDNANHTFNVEGEYNVILYAYSSSSSCYDSAMITIKVIGESVLDVPNVFTPNGDGKNDLFKPKAININTLNALVFNRWGKKVYEWEGVDNGWDGKNFAGKDCSDGTYFYLLKAEGADGQMYDMKGSVTLVR
jgi:gliding motility-associated-like protein